MAGLEADPALRSGTGLSLAQFRAIAWLRWRILANSYRRKGGALELVGRILLLPLFLALALLPTAAAGFFAWDLAREGLWGSFSLLFWVTFGLTQLLNINLGQPGTTFDPLELIRFPMGWRNYVLVRLCFGLLSPANVLVTLMSAAIFGGFVLARPGLWPWALLTTSSFALANVLFSRMIFAWVDRWLSTRRAREVFTALIFAGSLLFQYLNVTYNPGFQHGHQRRVTHEGFDRAQRLYAKAHTSLRWLPPELSAAALVAAQSGETTSTVLDCVATTGYAVLFLAVYALRMRTEYRGENLSDQANAVRRTPGRSLVPGVHPGTLPAAPSLVQATAAPDGRGASFLGPLLGKELLTLRRNTGLLYGVIAPTVMVFLFAGRISLRGGSHWLLLLAVAYALLGLAPLSYNSFGLEGPGAQMYFMAPVPLREVFFAKNLMQFLLAAFEVVSVILIVAYLTGRPAPLDVLFVLLWAAGTLLLNTTLGNLRSLSAPKKVNPGRSLNRAQSQVSAWIAIGVLLGCAAIGSGAQLLATLFHLGWLPLVVAAGFAAVGSLVYQQGLRGIERYAMDRRESLFEELGRKT